MTYILGEVAILRSPAEATVEGWKVAEDSEGRLKRLGMASVSVRGRCARPVIGQVWQSGEPCLIDSGARFRFLQNFGTFWRGPPLQHRES